MSPGMAGEALARRHDENDFPPKFIVLLWLNNHGQPVARHLLDHRQVAGVLDMHCPKETVYSVLKSAFVRLRQSGEHRAAEMLAHVLEIRRALASEKDLDTLLGHILTHARHLTGADGASMPSPISNDALTAGDFPSKRALPEKKALDILAAVAKADKIDSVLYKVIVESGAWRLKH